MSLLFVNAAQIVTCAGPGRARRGTEMADAAVLTGVALAVEDDRVAAIGPESDLARAYPRASRVDCEQGVITPVILITALPDRHLDDEATSRGALCLLRKPFEISALLDCIGRSLLK